METQQGTQRTQREVYEALLRMSREREDAPARPGELVLMSALCRELDCADDRVDTAARALESSGWIICAPSSGKIAVLALAKIGDPDELA